MYVVTATWVAKEGEQRAIEQILRTIAEASEQEPGCRAFKVYRALDEPRRYLLYEVYDDEAAFRAHRETDHFKTHVLGDAVNRLDQRFASFFEPID